MASFTSCSPGSFHFTYLGIPVRESMVKVKWWQIGVGKSWNLSLFFGRLLRFVIFLKLAGRPEEDSLVKCDPLLNSKEKYGLDVGSLDAFNFGSFV
uniref:Uncharacterized protein n=1 Tax=Lactuca sativa TaxID=4236 RepID=A0A9R1UET4_LACSA|nr:hypothetical protein LSAT_V11C900468330 [Lactuca sativa]